MSDLNITLIQADMVWEDKTANLRAFDEKLDQVPPSADIIILPEMFTTGFTMNAAPLAEKPGAETLEWMREKAAAGKVHLVGSFIVQTEQGYVNRLHWVKPDKSFEIYDKRHLFRMAGEHNIYVPGTKKRIVTVKGWKIAPFICYDLRFPVWSRVRNLEADLLIYIANWPERRVSHWNLLLQARAVENQTYVAGVNRVGRDGLDINYTGMSAVYDPLGRAVAGPHDNSEGVINATLNRAEMERYRTKFPAWKDADSFSIEERYE